MVELIEKELTDRILCGIFNSIFEKQ